MAHVLKWLDGKYLPVKFHFAALFAAIGIVCIGLIASANPLMILAIASLSIFGILALGFGYPERQPASQVETSFASHTYDSAARLADSFNEAVITINPKREIIFANKAAKKLLPNITIGKSVTKVIRHPNLKDVVKEVIRGNKPEPLNYIIHTPVEQHFKINASELGNDPDSNAPNAMRIILVLYDITDVERVNTLRADFLANASHELKTPVASLLGYIETLNGHAKDDPIARSQFLGIMQQQAERMQRLIDDLLSLRRIEQTEHIAPTEVGDLYLAARAATEAVAPMAKRRKIKTKYKGPKSLPVIGQQDQLVQLVLNIVDNAVQMSPPGSKVHLTGSILENWQPGDGFSEERIDESSARRRIINPPTAGENYAVLRISDTGPGFKREHLPRLTERFYRITGDRSSRDRGTGLGLAIVKHIVLRHRGGLFIESAEGFGTEFILMLPVEIAEDQDNAATA